MKNLKYIRTMFGDFILFPAWLGHNEALESIKIKNPGVTLESAGLVALCPEGLLAHGESMSLGIKSLPEDTELLKKFLGME